MAEEKERSAMATARRALDELRRIFPILFGVGTLPVGIQPDVSEN